MGASSPRGWGWACLNCGHIEMNIGNLDSIIANEGDSLTVNFQE